MIKNILFILVVGLLSFFAGKSYMKMSYEHSDAVEQRKEYIFEVVSSMTMLEFFKEDITLAEKVHLSKVAGFFDEESSLFPMFTPQDNKEKKAYKILRERAKNYQNKYCKEKCLIKK